MTVPRYVDIGERLAADIDTMSPGDLLPAERELAQRFGVSRMTVRQALAVLADSGRIYSIRGHGTFVSERSVAKDATLTSFTEDMLARGMRPGSRLLEAVQVQAAPSVARALELEPGAAVYRVRRLRLADDVPMCIETVHLPGRLFPHLLDTDLTGSLYDMLATRYRTSVTRADQTVSAKRLSRTDADLLCVPAGAAALLVHRVGIDARGRLIEHGESIYRSDRYQFRLGTVRAT